MEGGFLIRLHTYFKIAIISVFCFLLVACSYQKPVNVQPIRIFLTGSGLNPLAKCVFEITDDAKLKITRGEGLIYDFYENKLTEEEYIKDSSVKQKTKRLSSKDIGEINNLISKVEKNGIFINDEYTNTYISDIAKIHMTVGDTEYKYNSYYYSPGFHYDEMNDLQKLACKLVELSPLNLGEYYVGTQ